MNIENIIETLNFSNYFWQIFTPILFTFLDIITGYIQALINKNVDSSVMREGLLHKILIIIIIIASCVIDVTFNLSIVTKFISIYIIIMELTSILENLNKARFKYWKNNRYFKKKGVEKMKLSKEELKQKINELAVDDDIKITLLEDVEDSFEVTEDNSEELEALQTKYEELKEKYKSRFLNGDDGKKVVEDDGKKEEELEEQEIVEEKDIFIEKEGE